MLQRAIGIFLACLCAALPATAAKSDNAQAPEGLAPGVRAPRFQLPVVNDFGDSRRFGPDRWTGVGGKKLVLLSFFATYCEPCKKEMPELARLYDKYKDNGLGVMLVSIDKGKDQKQAVIDLAKKNGVKFPVLHDRFQVVARRYKAERLPYMLMLDDMGVVRKVHIGYTDALKAELEGEVRRGLGLKAKRDTNVDAEAGDKKTKKSKKAKKYGKKKKSKKKSGKKKKKAATAETE